MKLKRRCLPDTKDVRKGNASRSNPEMMSKKLGRTSPLSFHALVDCVTLPTHLFEDAITYELF